MTNIFDTDIRYITVQEIKDTTSKTDLQNLADADVKILIAKAEKIIDDYLGYKIELTDNNKQDFKIATFYCVEQIFENGDLIRGAISVSGGSGMIKSEKVGDRQVVYDVGTTTTISNNNLQILGLPTQALEILNKYKNIFFNKTL